MATLTDNGIQIERLDDIIADLENKFRQIYGNDINLSPDTPDGQLIGLIAQMKADYEELAESIYKQLDPDLASGAWLEQRVAFAGLARKQAEFSRLRAVQLNGKPHTKIPADIIVSDGNQNRWRLEQGVTLNSNGSAMADFVCEQAGGFSVPPNTNLTLETVVLGLENVVNLNATDIGNEEETDSQLRSRFFFSRAKNGENTLATLQGKLSEITGVEKVLVLENREKTTQNGLSANSIAVTILGGNVANIRKVLLENTPIGITYVGNTASSEIINGKTQTVRFSRANVVDISVSMLLVRNTDFQEIDRENIKSTLSALDFQIGEMVVLSRLYSPINITQGFWVKELKIGKKGSVLNSDNIAITRLQYARILAENISIEVM